MVPSNIRSHKNEQTFYKKAKNKHSKHLNLHKPSNYTLYYNHLNLNTYGDMI